MAAFTTGADRAAGLVFDWNERDPKNPPPQGAFPAFALVDETLRDGLQNASVVDPPVSDKIRILHLMQDLGVASANIGIPSSSRRAFEDALALGREVAAARMSLGVSAAGRTVVSDVTPMVEISQRAGVAIEACLFIGSSPIRQYVEEWDVSLLSSRSTEAIDAAVRAGLSVSFVTEDTTRSRPEVLSALFRAAIDHGASRIVLSDTVGHATRDGVRSLVRFTAGVIAASGARVGIDWHGHNDRGLALSNALAALEFGADRAHGTALGIGERVGNAPIELLLLNLRLGNLPSADFDGPKLLAYCEAVAKAVGWTIPPNYPLVGRDAFRTASGVHAAAIAKALRKGDAWLADRVYSGVPAAAFGREQEIGIGFMSGSSNVVHWLRSRGLESSDALVAAVLEQAKRSTRTLSDEEVLALVKQFSAL